MDKNTVTMCDKCNMKHDSDKTCAFTLCDKCNAKHFSDKPCDSALCKKCCTRHHPANSCKNAYELSKEKEQELEVLARACFAYCGVNPDAICPHGLPFYACMPCSH